MTTITLLIFALTVIAIKRSGFKFTRVTNSEFYYTLLIMLCVYLGYITATSII
jgi:hypothetical protein